MLDFSKWVAMWDAYDTQGIWGGDLCAAAREWAYATGVYWQCLER